MKKNIFPIVIALFVGLVAGYVIKKITPEKKINFAGSNSWTQEEKDAFKAYVKENSFKLSAPLTDIDPILAKKMIESFVIENGSSSLPLLTSTSEKLKGFYIDRQSLQKALSSTRATGVSFYLGKVIGGAPRTYTLIYMGAKQQGPDTAPDITNSLDRDVNPPQDYIKPCPTHCGNF
jgi:hypothetical protein